jgi:hypothetical protein
MGGKVSRKASVRARLASRSALTSPIACKGCQSFLPRDDNTLSAIQLPLPSKELLFQLNDHHR